MLLNVTGLSERFHGGNTAQESTVQVFVDCKYSNRPQACGKRYGSDSSLPSEANH